MCIGGSISARFVTVRSVGCISVSIGSVINSVPANGSLEVGPAGRKTDKIVAVIAREFFMRCVLMCDDSLTGTCAHFGVPCTSLHDCVGPRIGLAGTRVCSCTREVFVSGGGFCSISDGDGLVGVMLGGVCALSGCFFVSVSVVGGAGVQCSVSRVHFGVRSGGRAGTAGFRSVRVLPLVRIGGGLIFGGGCQGVFIFRGFAFPSRGILAVRVSRGRVSKHAVALEVSCTSVLRTSTFARWGFAVVGEVTFLIVALFFSLGSVTNSNSGFFGVSKN